MGKASIGTVLDGRYRLDEIVGTGTMGTVFRATHLTVHRPVAVKVLNASVQHHPKLQKRFEIEARAVGSLNHPNVLTLFDFAYSMDKDVLYMVVEFIEGDTLTDLIAGGLSAKLSTHIAYQVANALEHAHHAGVAHRDLKPGNVMLAHERRGERVKVLDFGLARMRTSSSAKRVTGVGSDVQGAPGYMSPEQCVGDMEAGAPSDIYALGCMMYEMYEGALPFDYDAPGKLMNGHIHEPAPTPASTAIGDDVRDLVRQMLDKTPEQRPTAEQVMDVLQPYVDIDVSLETLVRPAQLQDPAVVKPQPPPARAEPVGDSRAPLYAIIAVLALVALSAVLYAATR